MSFNSVVFAFFLPTVFFAYWALRRDPPGRQNLFLLAASYVFYGYWDVRFLALLAGTSLFDYFVGLRLEAETRPRVRRAWLWLSLASNLSVLGFFKYCDFFLTSFASLLSAAGIEASLPVLHIILPVGISFYTFQSLSYTIEVYRGRLKANHDLVAFLAFVSFFPQLVAGPIERAMDLMPQFFVARRFDEARAREGLREMLWGFAKKLVVADNLAPRVDEIFSHYSQADAPTLVAGAFFFAIQIYCDFSGYSHIARGTARLFGFELCRNFRHPYFSRDIGEFWRRWHVSLSTWFRDFVYIPLGGSESRAWRHGRNILLTFGVSGLWHGANWTYVCWGLLNGLYYLPLLVKTHLWKEKADSKAWTLPARTADAPRILVTFTMTTLAWVFFRSATFADALGYLRRIADPSLWHIAAPDPSTQLLLALCAGLLALEWMQRDKAHALEIGAWPVAWRWTAYYALTLTIFFLANLKHVSFIYFQF